MKKDDCEKRIDNSLWIAKFDKVKLAARFENDKQLAEAIGLTSTQISKIRAGLLVPSLRARVRLLDIQLFGKAREGVLEQLFEGDSLDNIIRKHNQVIARMNAPKERPTQGSQDEREEN